MILIVPFLSCDENDPTDCGTDLSRVEITDKEGDYILLTGMNVLPRWFPDIKTGGSDSITTELTVKVEFLVEMEYMRIDSAESPFPITEPKKRPINRIGFSRYWDEHHLSFNKTVKYYGDDFQKIYEPNENIFKHFYSPENRVPTGLYPPGYIALGYLKDNIKFYRNYWYFEPGCYEMILGLITKYDEWFFDTVNVYIDVEAELWYKDKYIEEPN
ncbi:MAG: hypothetical protein ISR82_05070 [Candidatus Marinimicrobia bacterium]|nr:hypothetical protein [Candidatus Neomarinimicrobiota bacterium]MBL7010571.1 hypothetical protein [Candidatus Neomarinimicrobiota bacterium]MBL7030800.1 hypothetical protein [Candidatus Neomarinimicrobiota bacterium]